MGGSRASCQKIENEDGNVHQAYLNGNDEAPLYKYLKSQKEGRIKWNFTKFLIGADGEVKARFEPTQKPETIESAIAQELH